MPEIDGLRFIAIISVVFFHAHHRFLPADPWELSFPWNVISHTMLQGWFGVQLFFIISGFILAMPFAERYLKKGPAFSLQKYYLRRVTRLEPPYVINLILGALLLIWFNGRALGDVLPHFLASLFYSHNLFYHPQMNEINFVIWTLEIEVQFYVLAPLLSRVFAIASPGLRRSVIIVAILVSCSQAQYFFSDTLNMTLLGQIRYFLIGFLLADLFLVDWQGAPTRHLGWDLLGLAGWLSIPLLVNRGFWGNFLLPAMLLLAYVAAFRGRLINTFFRNRWIVVIGGMCYTIYLYHMPLMHWVSSMVGQPRKDQPALAVGQMAIVWTGIVLCSGVLFALLEKPFMRRDWPARLRQTVLLAAGWGAQLPTWAARAWSQARNPSGSMSDESAGAD